MSSLQSFVIFLSIAALFGLFLWDSIERNSSVAKTCKTADSAIRYYVNKGFRLTVKTEHTVQLIRQKQYSLLIMLSDLITLGIFSFLSPHQRKKDEMVFLEFAEEGIISNIRKE